MSLDLQPVLENKWVKLRPLEIGDLEPLFQAAKDPLIWEQHPCKRHQRMEFESYFEESLQSKGALVVIDQTTQHIIGSSRYKLLPQIPHGLEIGWSFLSRSYWGGATNGAVKSLMLEHAFKYTNQVVFIIDPQNIRSQKAVEKIGGVKVDLSQDPQLQVIAGSNLIFMVSQ